MKMFWLMVAAILFVCFLGASSEDEQKAGDFANYSFNVQDVQLKLKLPSTFKKVESTADSRLKWQNENGERWTLEVFGSTLTEVVKLHKGNMETVCRNNDLAFEWLKNGKLDGMQEAWSLNLVTNPVEAPEAKTYYVQRLVQENGITFSLTYRVPAPLKKERAEVEKAAGSIFANWSVQNTR